MAVGILSCFIAPQTTSGLLAFISGGSRGGIRQRILKCLAHDMIKGPSCSAKKKIKITFLQQKGRLDWIFIKLCQSDHTLIGALFLRIEAEQEKVGVSATEKSLWCDLLRQFSFAQPAELEASAGALAGKAHTSISALFFAGGLGPAELLSFSLRGKKLSQKIK